MQWLIDIITDWIKLQGYVTMAEVLAEIQGSRFLAFRTGSAQAIGGAWLIVKFNNEIFDTKNEFHLLTSRFTAAQSGYYWLSWQVGFRPVLTANRKFFAALYVNNVRIASSLTQSSHNDYLAVGSGTLYYLNAGDIADIRAVQTSGFNVNIDYTNQLTYFCIDRKV